MKRTKQRLLGDKVSITKIWTIFIWEDCIICNKQFRREWGWRHTTHSYRAVWRHACRKCCPTREDALEAIHNFVEEKIKNRPPPPPAPPPMRIIREGYKVKY